MSAVLQRWMPITLGALVVFAMGAFLVQEVIPARAAGSTHYVDIQNPSCDNNGPGSQTTPWCTLNKAVVTLSAGDTAYVAPGTYNIGTGSYLETIGVPGDGTVTGLHPAHAGTATQPIRLIAQTTAADIIGDGNAPEAQDDAHQAFLTNGLFLIDKNYWQLQGFYVRQGGWLMSANNTGFRLSDTLIFQNPSSEVDLGGGKGLQLYNVDDAVVDHMEGWSLYLPEESSYDPGCTNTSSNPLSIIYSANVTVRNSYLYGAMNVHNFSGSDGVVIENNVMMNGGHIGGPDTNTGDSRNWIYRNNVFVGPGQEGPFVRGWCSRNAMIENGQIYNNLNIFTEGARLETASNSWPPFCATSKLANITIRNDLVVTRSGGSGCFSSWPPDVNIVDSDYNLCIYQQSNPEGNHYWWIDQTPTGYDLPEWRSQTAYPQIAQDPHSQFLNAVDPGYATALANLGAVDNRVDCGVYLPNVCGAGVMSNCAPPYRMKLLNDFTVAADSITRSGGDPAYEGGRIGPFSYTRPANTPPVLASIGPRATNENQGLAFTVTATDVDVGDDLAFSASNLPMGATFTDNPNDTGTFSWMPTASQAGTYANVQFSVSDGTDTDSETITITVNEASASCTPSWSCGEWSACSSGSQTRTCTDANECGTTVQKPAESQTCEVPTVTDTVPPSSVRDLRAP